MPTLASRNNASNMEHMFIGETLYGTNGKVYKEREDGFLEELPNQCDKCGREEVVGGEACEALGDGYYCQDCICERHCDEEDTAVVCEDCGRGMEWVDGPKICEECEDSDEEEQEAVKNWDDKNVECWQCQECDMWNDWEVPCWNKCGKVKFGNLTAQ
jgi:hypothetical protein